jgi:opacity protein-like surface antigen
MPNLLIRGLARGMVCLLFCSGILAAGDSRPLNRFSLGPRFALNINADFSNLGGVAPRNGSQPGIYDDGYNLIDSSGSADGTTWNWGYDRPEQYADDAIRLSQSSSPGALTAPKAGDDPHHGLELGYARELAQWGPTRWGLEAAFGYTAIRIRDTRALADDVVRVSDSFALDGVIPPLAPYRGTFEGPGPLLSTVPSSQTSFEAGAALVEGSRTLDTDLYAWRLGPYVELPLVDPVSLWIGGGLALAYLDSRFAYTETVSMPDVDSIRRDGSQSKDGWLVGGYAAAGVAVALDANWSVFAAAQYQNLGRFSQETDGKRARLDLGQAIFVHAGLSVHF